MLAMGLSAEQALSMVNLEGHGADRVRGGTLWSAFVNVVARSHVYGTYNHLVAERTTRNAIP
jgi:hypothetical protein